jgi:hypothetical protein
MKRKQDSEMPNKKVNVGPVTILLTDIPSTSSLCNLLKNQFCATPIPTDEVIVHANRLLFPIEMLQESFTLLIKAILENSDLDHITHDGQDYYQRTSLWTMRDKNKTYPEHDPDVPCEKYQDCERNAEVVDGDIKFSISYGLEDSSCDDENSKLGLSIEKTMHIHQPEKLWLSQFSKIIIENSSGFNDDHRGSDHLAIDVPFEPVYTIEKSAITLDDFAVGLYVTKSHRFDKWYELFLNVCNLSFNDGVLKLTLRYDHGS